VSTLIDQLRQGSESAFESIFKTYWEQVYLKTLKRVGDEVIAKEITQEIFIALWEKRGQLQIRGSIEAYLSGSVKFRVIDHFRANITRERHYEDMLLLMGDRDIENETESMYTVKAIEQALESVMVLMPERMRLIFAKSRIEQKTIAEISEELNLSGQTVKNQLSAALKLIRESQAIPHLLIFLFFIS